ncbi:MAG TPA: MATE family efflux transporter [Longimicrobiaceae bacterium]|jgi:putative MATE family efflux protein|nr:MATE family efflux transporter [Longimicrobiaceae bacterium]
MSQPAEAPVPPTVPEALVLPPAPEPPSRFRDSVREALRGSTRDYTQGPIGRAILVLAIPMVLEMVMESVFAVVDVFFVAHLGSTAVAAVGLTESMLTLIYAVAMGLAIGATATVARRTGEGDREGAARAAVQVLALGLGVSLVIGVVGFLLAPRLLGVMGAAPDVIAHGSAYTRIMLGGNVVILMLFLVNAVFRGAGDAAISMRVLWLANGINIVLCPCLILGLGPFPQLGVAGAAVATTIGRGTGALYALSRLVRPGGRVTVARRHLRLMPDVMGRIVRLSASGAFQVFVGMASWVGVTRILSTFGSDVVAGYTIGIRIVIFALLPSAGLSNAAATMVGQSLGAGKPQRAEQAVWRAGLYNLVFLGLTGAAFVFFAEPLIAIFTQDPAVAKHGVGVLRIVALGFPFYAFGMVFGMSLNGAGDTRTPTILNLVVFWLFEIPLAYVLAKTLGMGPRGVFIALPIAFSTHAVVSGLLFRRGRWKTRTV